LPLEAPGQFRQSLALQGLDGGVIEALDIGVKHD